MPYDVKQLIREKCMETSENSEWNFIPKFKNSLDGDNKQEEPSKKEEPEEEDDNAEEDEKDESEKKTSVTSDDRKQEGL